MCKLDVRANRWKLAFAPDGKKLASTGNDQVLRIHDAATGKTLREWPNPSLQFANDGHICFSPDGNLLATLGRKEVQFRPLPSNEQAVRLWEAKTGKLWRLLDIGNSRVMTTCAPTFSPNGRMLVSADADGAIQLWEVATGKLRRLLPGHGGPITSLAFSPNGKSLASGGADTTALIWEAYAAPPNAKPQARDELWNLLASNDAAQAFAAMTTLIRMPKETAAYFKDHLAPVRAAGPKANRRFGRCARKRGFSDPSRRLERIGETGRPGRSGSAPSAGEAAGAWRCASGSNCCSQSSTMRKAATSSAPSEPWRSSKPSVRRPHTLIWKPWPKDRPAIG